MLFFSRSNLLEESCVQAIKGPPALTRTMQTKRNTTLTWQSFGIALVLLLSKNTLAVSPVRAYLTENRLEDAVGACRQVEVLGTSDVDSVLACAWVYYRTDRIAAAEKILERVKRKSNLPEYQLLIALGKMKAKDYGEAKKILDNVTNENRGTATGLSAQELQGENYEMQGQLSTAAFLYKQVIGDDPKRARSQWGLARYHLSQGDTNRAARELETVALLWPKHVASRFDLAVLAISQDNLKDGAKWLMDCYRLNRADPGVLEQMGILFEKKGQISEAVRYWQKTLDLKKDSPIAKEKMAHYAIQVIDNLMEAGKLAEALVQLKKPEIADQPGMALRRGIVYRTMGQYEKAAVDLRAALVTKPGDPRASRELGVCYVNLKLLSQAANSFRKAVQGDPDNAINHAWLAWVYESQRDWTQARQEWQRTIEVATDPVALQRASRRLASVEKQLGDGKGSRKRKGMDMGVAGEKPESEDEE